MITNRQERKAIHDSATIFTEINWFFREQPISDFGIDAFVETCDSSNRPSGQFIALQIKGGNSNFHRSKKELTFYFDEKHKNYWLEVGKTIPVFIILQDSTGSLYWQNISKSTIIETPKHWKVLIPLENKLIKQSVSIEIEKLVKSHYNSDSYTEEYIHLINDYHSYPPKSLIEFNLNEKDELRCLVNKNQEHFSISFKYNPPKNQWNAEKQELEWPNPYCFTINGLRSYLESKLEGDQKKDSSKLKKELDGIIESKGMDGISELVFNDANSNLDIPKYEMFTKAFESYISISKRDEYEVQIVSHLVNFKYKDSSYDIDTYSGKIQEIRKIIENRSYDEIYTQTNEQIWSDIYLDAGIEKHRFIPELQKEWEHHWGNFYTKIFNSIGSTKHLDSSKEKSWRHFQTFSNNYNEVGDIIEFAYSLDEMTLYPVTVLAMLNVFDSEVCYHEYAELELESIDWECISIDEKADSPLFYVQQREI